MESNEWLYGYGCSCYNAGMWKEAISAFSTLCKDAPLEPKFWFGMGASYQESGQYERALSAWAMTALLDTADPYPHFHAAECAFSLQQMADGEKALKEAQMRTKENDPLWDKIEALQKAWSIWTL